MDSKGIERGDIMKKSIKINETVQAIESMLKEQGLWYNMNNCEDEINVFTFLPIQNVLGLFAQLYVESNGDCMLFCVLKRGVPREESVEIIGTLNELNFIHRYICLSLNEGDVCVSYDFSVYTDNEIAVSEQILAELLRFALVCDQCIPTIFQGSYEVG